MLNVDGLETVVDTDEPQVTGSLSILNVGRGDMKITFNGENGTEVERAKRTIRDMLKRGYTLLVSIDGTLHKVTDFRDDTAEYIVLETPADTAELVANDPLLESSEPTKGKRGRPRKRGVPMATSTAHAVAPTAGG